MPFGLTNAPSTFQLTMNGVFRDMLDKKFIIYLDDILVYSKTKEEHFKDLEEVFRRLQQNRLITKGSKCEFLKPELEFLGHVFSGDGIKIDPRKVDAIAKWNPPTKITELQSFQSTTLTPLSRPVAVSLADPSSGPVLAHSSTVLPCPAAPSGLLSGLHLPSFSTKLVSGADLQDLWVDQFTPGGQRVTHCTCSRTGRHLATFTRQPGSSLYTLTTASPPVTACGQVAASGQGFAAASRSSPASAPCSCRPLSYETLLWHHRLGHPSLPHLRGMASRTPGRQHAAPHSSEFPPTEAPLQTLHMDMWGPARVSGQGHERYFLLVIDDYSRYTTVFPLRRKGETEVYTAHQINLQPRVSLPETTPTLRWTGKVGDASVFRVWGSRAFVRDTSADKLSSRAVPCVFLGFPP
ncbi:unnamed protein product [Closterium sp. NIES-53]